MAYGILTFARRLWNRRHVLFSPGAVRRLAHSYSAVPKGCGFTLQNRGSGFVLEDGHPNNVEVRLHHFFSRSPWLLIKSIERQATLSHHYPSNGPQGRRTILKLWCYGGVHAGMRQDKCTVGM